MMEGIRKLCPLCLVIISLSISCLSEARHHPHKAYAVVVGTVLCDACFQDDMSKGNHYISGATVAIECAEGASGSAFYKEMKTDTEGKFKVQLPFSISKHVNEIEGCTAKLIKSSEPNCAIASKATSSLIHLKYKKGGKHIFSAGFFTFKPLNQQGLCDQQPSVTNSQQLSLQDLFPNPALLIIPTLPNPPALPNPNLPFMSNLPYIPQLPPLPELPKLPPLPLLPPFRVTPVAPFKDEKVEHGLVKHPHQLSLPMLPPVFTSLEGPLPTTIPNPLQTLPLVPSPFNSPTLATPSLTPNPFQHPSPPPTILPPVSPPPNLPNLPPVPILTPLTHPIPEIIPPVIPPPPTP